MCATKTSSQPNCFQPQSGKTIAYTKWFERVHWENVFWIIVFPLFGLAAAAFTPLHTKTAIWALVYYITTGLGITAGYHRLWAHRSYTASLPLKIWLASVGGGAMEHSIINWSRDHRDHHRYTDTAKDPYSVQTGLFHAHIGWLIFRRDSKCQGDADISDLMNDPIVVWQHDHYTVIAMSMAYILPCCIGGLWGDWWGGFIYAGIIRALLVQQSTFCVNSIAHWLGDHTYDDRNSPRDHVFTALITLGEGYHNFHHEFPSDYRNAIAWYQYDPTKWMIWLWKQVGLAHNLKVFRQNEIEKGKLQQQQKKLDLTLAELRSTKLQLLPVMEWDAYQDEVLKGRSWLTIAGVVYDVGRFVEEHPGGESMIYSGIGKDATAMFNGGVYNHSNAAHRLLATMQVGIIRGGGEVEILKHHGNVELLGNNPDAQALIYT